MKTRILGIVLLVVALGVAAWLITGLLESDGSKAGYVLGLCLFSLPFFAVGLYLLLTSRGEIKTESRMDQQRTILNAVMTRGRVSVADLAIECNASRDQVKQYIYDLIGKDLFRGYVNWEKGELVSAEAAQMKEGTCPNCGGKLELAGKGRQGTGALPLLRHRDLPVGRDGLDGRSGSARGGVRPSDCRTTSGGGAGR